MYPCDPGWTTKPMYSSQDERETENPYLYFRSGVPNPAPADRLSCTVHLQPKSNTPALNFQVILKTLIGCFRCVWLGLEINCAGQSIGRSRVGHPCFRLIPFKGLPTAMETTKTLFLIQGQVKARRAATPTYHPGQLHLPLQPICE